MKPIDDESPDPEDEISAPDTGEAELGQGFYFRKQKLAPLSYNYRAALNRLLSGGGSMSQYEYDFLFVFLLLQKPAVVDQIRTPEQVTAFRLKVGEWVEKEQLEPKWEAITKLVASIEKPVAAAEHLEPTAPEGATPSASGNE